MSERIVTIIIDGTEVKAKAGETILQAADKAGIYIPRLCHTTTLPPGGHCRVCTVKVNGKPVNACTFPVGDGQVVENNTPELTACRRQIIELLFSEGNHYCPACETSGNCELQAMGYRLGMLAPSLPFLNMPREIDATHKDVFIDRNRCILCGRCVRSSRVVDGKGVFGFEGRGIHKRIAVDGEALADTPMASTDAAATACPTGCLVIKRTGWATPVGQRKYDLAPIGSDIEQKQPVG